MNDRFRRQTNHHGMTDLFFMLILLSAFALLALAVVMTGAQAYEKIVRVADANSQLRIPLTYIASKVRQADMTGAVRIADREGVRVLVLESADGDILLETWIYELDGMLCEVTLEKGMALSLADGMAIMPVRGFDLSTDSADMLAVTINDSAGRSTGVALSLRSDIPAPGSDKAGAE